MRLLHERGHHDRQGPGTLILAAQSAFTRRAARGEITRGSCGVACAQASCTDPLRLPGFSETGPDTRNRKSTQTRYQKSRLPNIGHHIIAAREQIANRNNKECGPVKNEIRSVPRAASHHCDPLQAIAPVVPSTATWVVSQRWRFGYQIVRRIPYTKRFPYSVVGPHRLGLASQPQATDSRRDGTFSCIRAAFSITLAAVRCYGSHLLLLKFPNAYPL